MMTVRTLTLTPPTPSRKEILRYAGERGDASYGTVLDECIAEALSHLSYRVSYAVFPIRRTEAGLDLGFMQTASSGLAKCLSPFDHVLVLGATLGHAYDRLLMRASASSALRSLFFDAIGAERIEALCDTFCAKAAQEYESAGGALGKRYSPGYGDLPLAVQRDIFRVMDFPRHIGLTLNESLLMTPRKSVTAFVGVRLGTSRTE